LTQASIKEIHNFWDFWISWNEKRVIAIMLIVFAVGTSLGYFLIFPNKTIKTEEIAIDSNDLATKTTIVATTPHDIPKA
jgi:hypothetical protein